MSPINTLSVLAFASVAFAVPHAHENHHAHLHHHVRAAKGESGSGAAPYPVPSSSGAPYNYGSSGFGPWYGTGGGYGSGYGWSSTPSSPVGPEQTNPGYGGGPHGGPASTSTVLSTIWVSPSPSPAATADPVDNGVCIPDVTVTKKVYVTVTAGSTPTAAAQAWSPPAASPAAAQSTTSSSADPSPYNAGAWASPSSPAAAADPTSAAWTPADPSYGSAPTSAAASPSSTSSSSGSGSGSGLGLASAFSGGKKGLAYNSASLVTPFIGASGVGWAYNWVSGSAGLASGIPYVAELHDMTETFTSVWMEQAQAAIDAGTEYLFSFNEPDIASQANLSPEAAAAGWKQYMEPFAGKAKLVAPAVSNSATPGQGLSWLSAFMAACDGCTFSAVNQHWYDSTSNDISYFQQQISQAASQSGLPVFVGEFGFIGDDTEIASALTQAMAWMDGEDSVVGYAYYFLSDGFLLDGTTPSPYGLAYLA